MLLLEKESCLKIEVHRQGSLQAVRIYFLWLWGLGILMPKMWKMGGQERARERENKLGQT